MEYYEALKKLYKPQIGSIWKAPNRIWTSGFASGAPDEDIHPSIVEKLHSSNITLSIAPGTSKEKHGSCVWTPMSEFDYFNSALKLYQVAIEEKLELKYYNPKTGKCLIPVDKNLNIINSSLHH